MAQQNEIKIQFKVEAAEFNDALKDIRNETTKLNKEFKLEQEQLKASGTEAEKLESRMTYLAKKHELAAKEVALTKEQLNKAKAAFGENADEVKALENKLLDAELAYQRVENQVASTSKALDDSKNKWKAASQAVGDFGDKASKAGDKMAPISAAAGAALGGMVGMAVKAGAAADDINTLAKVTGLSTEEIQKFQFASDQIDVSMDTLTGSMSKLTKNMAGARDASAGVTLSLEEQEKQAIAIEKAQIKYNEAVKKHGVNSLEARDASLKLKDVQDSTPAALKGAALAFDTLKVKVTDAQGKLRDNEAVFNDTIKALGSVKNETERDALAMQIFGKSAQELNPLILGGADALKEIGDAAASRGLILSQEELDQANALNDSLDQLKAEGMAGLMSMGSQLAPILIPMFQALSEGLSGLVTWFSSLDEGTLKLILTILAVVAAVAPVLMFIGKLATGISAIMSLVSALGPVIAIITGPVGLVIAAIAAAIAIGVLLYKNWDTIKQKAGEIFASVSATFNGIRDAISGAINGAKDAVGAAIDRIKGFFNFSWSLPKLKMPSISMEGKFSLAPPSVPKFGIKWNADGAIFTKPTVFNTAQGLQGVGEAGAEAVLPISKLAGMIRDVMMSMPDMYVPSTNRMDFGGNLNLNVTGNTGMLDTRAIAETVLDQVLDHLTKGNRTIPNKVGLFSMG
jgi:phage-related minor tail protein